MLTQGAPLVVSKQQYLVLLCQFSSAEQHYFGENRVAEPAVSNSSHAFGRVDGRTDGQTDGRADRHTDGLQTNTIF